MNVKSDWMDGDEVTAAAMNAVANAINDGAAASEQLANKNQPSGYAGLDGGGKVSAAQLPSYVDDVLEFSNQAAFPATGETGKIYVAIDTGDSFRWSGSVYARISDRVTASGITDATPFVRTLMTTATDAAATRAAIDAFELTVDGTRTDTYDLDPAPLTASDVGAYARAEVDDAIDAAKNGPQLVTPSIDSVKDSNRNSILDFSTQANAVNRLGITNAPAGLSPSWYATGPDADISGLFRPKRAGRFTVYVETGQTPTVSGSGDDPNHDFNLLSKGALSAVQANGFDITTTSVVSVTGTVTLGAVRNRHYIVLLGSGAVPALPTAVGNSSVYYLKNVHSASIAVAVTGAQTIDGWAGSLTILPKQCFMLVSDGSNWVIIEGYNTGYWDGHDLASGEPTIPRRATELSTVTTGNGILRLTYLVARKGETVTQVRTISGATAQAGATLCKVGVYLEDSSGNLTLVASTANTTTLWATTNTAYTTSLSASFAKARGMRYAVGILVTGASTAPTLNGDLTPTAGSENSQSPRLAALVSASDLLASISVGSLSDSTVQHYAALLP